MLNVANNLRVACHRLKKMLVDAGLPEYDYIVIESGIYRFDAPMKTEVDALMERREYEEVCQVQAKFCLAGRAGLDGQGDKRTVFQYIGVYKACK